ncbi:MAG: cobalamin biosynthesis protein, partial [Acidobacteria bacterium]|nr:cobalamin biosynthesis protein [Acidobacteriota bacterium]MDW7984044.1 CobD/CbiB family cobalamin biosynthesis protein [Acidobacteriota bacterium]
MTSGEDSAVVTWLLAVAMDIGFGDPPNRWHPVAWMGRMLAGWERRVTTQKAVGRFLHGTLACGTGLLIWSFAAWLWEVGARYLPVLPCILLQALALKMTFSVRGLFRAAQEIRQLLTVGDLAAARYRVGYHLVSRPTQNLDGPHVVSAVIESVAENACDGWLAPAFYYAVGGLP